MNSKTEKSKPQRLIKIVVKNNSLRRVTNLSSLGLNNIPTEIVICDLETGYEDRIDLDNVINNSMFRVNSTNTLQHCTEDDPLEIYFEKEQKTVHLPEHMRKNLIHFFKQGIPKDVPDYCCDDFAQELRQGRSKRRTSDEPNKYTDNDKLIRRYKHNERYIVYRGKPSIGDYVLTFGEKEGHALLYIGEGLCLSNVGRLVVTTIEEVTTYFNQPRAYILHEQDKLQYSLFYQLRSKIFPEHKILFDCYAVKPYSNVLHGLKISEVALKTVAFYLDAKRYFQAYQLSKETGDGYYFRDEAIRILGAWYAANVLGRDWGAKSASMAWRFTKHPGVVLASGVLGALVGSVVGYTGGGLLAQEMHVRAIEPFFFELHRAIKSLEQTHPDLISIAEELFGTIQTNPLRQKHPFQMLLSTARSSPDERLALEPFLLAGSSLALLLWLSVKGIDYIARTSEKAGSEYKSMLQKLEPYLDLVSRASHQPETLSFEEQAILSKLQEEASFLLSWQVAIANKLPLEAISLEAIDSKFYESIIDNDFCNFTAPTLTPIIRAALHEKLHLFSSNATTEMELLELAQSKIQAGFQGEFEDLIHAGQRHGLPVRAALSLEELYEVGRSQLRIMHLILENPEHKIMMEGLIEQETQQSLSKVIIDEVQACFPTGEIPQEFLELTLPQKLCIMKHEAAKTLLALGEISAIYPASSPIVENKFADLIDAKLELQSDTYAPLLVFMPSKATQEFFNISLGYFARNHLVCRELRELLALEEACTTTQQGKGLLIYGDAHDFKRWHPSIRHISTSERWDCNTHQSTINFIHYMDKENRIRGIRQTQEGVIEANNAKGSRLKTTPQYHAPVDNIGQSERNLPVSTTKPISSSQPNFSIVDLDKIQLIREGAALQSKLATEQLTAAQRSQCNARLADIHDAIKQLNHPELKSIPPESLKPMWAMRVARLMGEGFVIGSAGLIARWGAQQICDDLGVSDTVSEVGTSTAAVSAEVGVARVLFSAGGPSLIVVATLGSLKEIAHYMDKHPALTPWGQLWQASVQMTSDALHGIFSPVMGAIQGFVNGTQQTTIPCESCYLLDDGTTTIPNEVAKQMVNHVLQGITHAVGGSVANLKQHGLKFTNAALEVKSNLFNQERLSLIECLKRMDYNYLPYSASARRTAEAMFGGIQDNPLQQKHPSSTLFSHARYLSNDNSPSNIFKEARIERLDTTQYEAFSKNEVSMQAKSEPSFSQVNNDCFTPQQIQQFELLKEHCQMAQAMPATSVLGNNPLDQTKIKLKALGCRLDDCQKNTGIHWRTLKQMCTEHQIKIFDINDPKVRSLILTEIVSHNDATHWKHLPTTLYAEVVAKKIERIKASREAQGLVDTADKDANIFSKLFAKTRRAVGVAELFCSTFIESVPAISKEDVEANPEYWQTTESLKTPKGPYFTPEAEAQAVYFWGKNQEIQHREVTNDRDVGSMPQQNTERRSLFNGTQSMNLYGNRSVNSVGMRSFVEELISQRDTNHGLDVSGPYQKQFIKKSAFEKRAEEEMVGEAQGNPLNKKNPNAALFAEARVELLDTAEDDALRQHALTLFKDAKVGGNKPRKPIIHANPTYPDLSSSANTERQAQLEKFYQKTYELSDRAKEIRQSLITGDDSKLANARHYSDDLKDMSKTAESWAITFNAFGDAATGKLISTVGTGLGQAALGASLLSLPNATILQTIGGWSAWIAAAAVFVSLAMADDDDENDAIAELKMALVKLGMAIQQVLANQEQLKEMQQVIFKTILDVDARLKQHQNETRASLNFISTLELQNACLSLQDDLNKANAVSLTADDRRQFLSTLERWLKQHLFTPAITMSASATQSASLAVELLSSHPAVNIMGFIMAQLQSHLGEKLIPKKYGQLPPLPLFIHVSQLFLQSIMQAECPSDDACASLCKKIDSVLADYIELAELMRGSSEIWSALFAQYEHQRNRVGRALAQAGIPNQAVPIHTLAMSEIKRMRLMDALDGMEERRLFLTSLYEFAFGNHLSPLYEKVQALESKQCILGCFASTLYVQNDLWKYYPNQKSTDSTQMQLALKSGVSLNLSYGSGNVLNYIGYCMINGWTSQQHSRQFEVDLVYLLMQHSSQDERLHPSLHSTYCPGNTWGPDPRYAMTMFSNCSRYDLALLLIIAGFDKPWNSDSLLNSDWWAESAHLAREYQMFLSATIRPDGVLNRHKLIRAFEYYQACERGEISKAETMIREGVDASCVLWLVSLLGKWYVFEQLTQDINLSQNLGAYKFTSSPYKRGFVTSELGAPQYTVRFTQESHYIPLMVAAEHGREDVIEGLIRLYALGKDIGINHTLHCGNSAAALAFQQNHFDIAQCLYDLGSPLSATQIATLNTKALPKGPLPIPQNPMISLLEQSVIQTAETSPTVNLQSLSSSIQHYATLFKYLLDSKVRTVMQAIQRQSDLLNKLKLFDDIVQRVSVITDKGLLSYQMKFELQKQQTALYATYNTLQEKLKHVATTYHEHYEGEPYAPSLKTEYNNIIVNNNDVDNGLMLPSLSTDLKQAHEERVCALAQAAGIHFNNTLALIRDAVLHHQHMESCTADTAVLLLGATGVGKSAFFNFMSGRLYKKVKQSGIRMRELIPGTGTELSPTNQGARSETRFPVISTHQMQNGVLAIVDLPGFLDNSENTSAGQISSYDIAAALSMQLLTKKIKNISGLIAACSEAQIAVERPPLELQETFRQIGRMIKDKPELANNVRLFVTKHDTDYEVVDVTERLKKLAIDFASDEEMGVFLSVFSDPKKAESRIVLTDVTDDDDRMRYFAILDALTPQDVNKFNFSSHSVVLLKLHHLVDKLIESRAQVLEELSALRIQRQTLEWLDSPEQLMDVIPQFELSIQDDESLESFLKEQAVLLSVFEKMTQLNGLLDNVQQLEERIERAETISKRIEHLSLQASIERDFINQLAKLGLCDELIEDSLIIEPVNMTKGNLSQFSLFRPEHASHIISTHSIPVLGDGNCFFRAIATELNRQGIDETATYAQVRAKGIEYLKAHPDLLLAEDASRYLVTMSQDKVWAEGPIIDAVALAYDLQLSIVDERTQFMGNSLLHPLQKNEEGQHLIGLRRRDNLHYDALDLSVQEIVLNEPRSQYSINDI